MVLQLSIAIEDKFTNFQRLMYACIILQYGKSGEESDGKLEGKPGNEAKTVYRIGHPLIWVC